MSAVLAVFHIEISQPFFLSCCCFDVLLAAPHISEGFRPETGIYYVVQFDVLPNPYALSQPSPTDASSVCTRGHMTSIGSIWSFTQSPRTINIPQRTHHQFVITTSLLLSPMATKQDTAWSLFMLAYTLPVQTLQLQGAFLLSSFQELELLWKEYQGIKCW